MNKALIVGISDYGSLKCGSADCGTLPGAAYALNAWTTLLIDHYGFVGPTASVPDIHQLSNTAATKLSVLSELSWLTANVSANDHVIFSFNGHGTTLNRLDPRIGTVNDEQGLICYPAPGDDLTKATLFGDEIIGKLGNTKARVLILIDACFGGGVFEPAGVAIKPLYIDSRSAWTDRFDVSLLVTLIERLDVLPDEVNPSMVVVAASRELENAHQGNVNGQLRLLFSHYATEALRLDATQSHNDVRNTTEAKLRPLQVPVLAGDATRYANRFSY